MTLGEFFEQVSANGATTLYFFSMLPITAGLTGYFGKDVGHESPWKYVYSTLIYLACIPGVFAFTLSIYMFLFQRGDIMQANIYTQILPIVIMFLTLWIIRKNVKFSEIPGFDKIGGLMTMLTILMSGLWILEKTQIFVITFMPFYAFIFFFIAMIFLFRWSLKRVMG